MINQTNMFLPNEKKYLFTNKAGDFNLDGWEVIIYDESLPYNQRISSCLEAVEEEVVILHHEDMFLLSEPYWAQIDNMVDLVASKQIDMIKLIKAAYNNIPTRQCFPNIYLNSPELYYAIQPTIIRKKTLHNIYRNVESPNIWQFEVDAGNYVYSRGMKSGYFSTGNEDKRGNFHWDSLVYPYIATAVVKGKWDFEHYRNELTELLENYNINPETRGTNG
jgi:hypothetical protein